MKKMIEADYDLLADSYEEYIETKHDFEVFNEYLPKNRNRFLDIGCGTGRLVENLAKEFKEAYGIDISSKMIEKAREKKIKNARFEKMDAESLIYPNEYFDYIVSVTTFHHLDLDKALKEVRRILKKGGVLIIIELISERKKINFPLCISKRVFRFIKNLIKIGPKKAKKRFKFDMDWLEHLKHDKWMNKKEFGEAYEQRLKDCKIGYTNLYGYVMWHKK